MGQLSELDSSLLDTAMTYAAEGDVSSAIEYIHSMSEEGLAIAAAATAITSVYLKQEMLGREVTSPR